MGIIVLIISKSINIIFLSTRCHSFIQAHVPHHRIGIRPWNYSAQLSTRRPKDSFRKRTLVASSGRKSFNRRGRKFPTRAELTWSRHFDQIPSDKDKMPWNHPGDNWMNISCSMETQHPLPWRANSWSLPGTTFCCSIDVGFYVTGHWMCFSFSSLRNALFTLNVKNSEDSIKLSL